VYKTLFILLRHPLPAQDGYGILVTEKSLMPQAQLLNPLNIVALASILLL
jgi:hypothetical protein